MKDILPGAPWLIAHKSMLTPNKPQKIKLNGKNYVIWKNSQGKVAVLDDMCPHQQAPLSQGWISPQNHLTCPFHGLEFDEKGRLCHQDKVKGKSLVTSLKIHDINDMIWTYGESTPRLDIPPLLPQLNSDYTFFGYCGEQTINSNFLNCLKINYDFNHVLTTHKSIANFSHLLVKNVELDKNGAKVTQEVFLKPYSFIDIMKKPALLASPSQYTNYFQYFFPSLTLITTEIKSLKLLQLIIIYPESQTQTKIFALLYAKIKDKMLLPFQSLIKKTLVKDFAQIIQQDATILESLYPSEKAKIRLPHDEIIEHAKTLYFQWQ